PGQVKVLERFVQQVSDLGWEVAEGEPDFIGADECFTTLRAWRFATGRAGQLGGALAEAKSTVQDEVRRGPAPTPEAIAKAYEHLAVLWRRAARFFADVDLLVAPVTQVAPFPVEWEYPISINDTPLDRYTDWMAVCCRITVLGAPALSLPAGFDD